MYKTQRPTHFVAVQVSHEKHVVEAIQRVQTALIGHTPGLKGARVDPVTAHMTLMVTRLEGAKDIERCRQALLSLRPVLKEKSLLAPVSLELQGLSHFRHQVLYLDVPPGDGQQQLVALAAAVREHFSSQGVIDDGQWPFTPHVTIAKMSNIKSFGARKKVGKIPEDAYRDLIHLPAGKASLSSLQLCAMQERKEGCYYPIGEVLPLQ